jgi:tRNA(Ile)-lysidine synthase
LPWPDLLARCAFPESGTAVTCAVSGGPDSLALLVLALEAGCAVTAVHVDHGLRVGSERDADVVAEVAAARGAAFRAVRAPVEPGSNVEARARAVRYSVMPPDVLTGHTADDQAETVLLNLLRGSGLDGLAGMRRRNRPLLSLRRVETRALCSELGLHPVQDETNDDLRFRRNQIRHEVMPALDDIAARDVSALIARQADILRDDADLLDQLALDLDPTDARALRDAPLPLARRAVRRWLANGHPPDSATVERVLAVARGEAIATETGDGRRIERHRQRLHLSGDGLT